MVGGWCCVLSREREMGEENRAIMFKRIGAWEEVLELVQLPKPQIRSGHVLVHVLLRPVHSADLLIFSDSTSAVYSLFELEENSETIRRKGFVCGQEGGVGIIEQIGEGVTLCSPGQRVHLNILYSSISEFRGSWQDYLLIKEEDALPVPDGISDEVAAQFSYNPWTAYGLVRDIDCPKGEYILISGAGSVLCRLLIQLAKHEGHKTIGIVRREELKKELLAFGAEAVINSSFEDVATAVNKVTKGQGAYLGIDSVGGVMTKSVAASVRDGGEVMVIGDLGSGDVVISQSDLLRKVRISPWYADPYFEEKDKIEATIRACWKNFEEGIWKLPPATKFDLSDFKQALRESQKAGRSGKVMLQSS